MAVTERWEYELLTLDDEPLGMLEGVEPGGRLTFNVNSQIRGGGTLRWHASREIDWMRHRLRVWFSSDGHRWPMGVYVVAAPEREFDDGDLVQPLTLLDKTSIVAEAGRAGIFSLPQGTNITETVVQLVREAGGGDSIAATHSGAVTESVRSWDLQDSTLRVVNDLLTSVNYFGLWVDRSGQFWVEPYSLPRDRPTVRTFRRGEASVHLPSLLASTTDFSTPNRVTVGGEALRDEDGQPLPPVWAVAENRDPASRFSYERRGRWIDKTYENVEGSLEALQGLARRYLDELSTSSETVVFRHRHLPLWLNEVIRLEDRVEGRFTVETMDYTMTPGALVTTKARRVNEGS